MLTSRVNFQVNFHLRICRINRTSEGHFLHMLNNPKDLLWHWSRFCELLSKKSKLSLYTFLISMNSLKTLWNLQLRQLTVFCEWVDDKKKRTLHPWSLEILDRKTMTGQTYAVCFFLVLMVFRLRTSHSNWLLFSFWPDNSK